MEETVLSKKEKAISNAAYSKARAIQGGDIYDEAFSSIDQAFASQEAINQASINLLQGAKQATINKVNPNTPNYLDMVGENFDKNFGGLANSLTTYNKTIRNKIRANEFETNRGLQIDRLDLSLIQQNEQLNKLNQSKQNIKTSVADKIGLQLASNALSNFANTVNPQDYSKPYQNYTFMSGVKDGAYSVGSGIADTLGATVEFLADAGKYALGQGSWKGLRSDDTNFIGKGFNYLRNEFNQAKYDNNHHKMFDLDTLRKIAKHDGIGMGLISAAVSGSVDTVGQSAAEMALMLGSPASAIGKGLISMGVASKAGSLTQEAAAKKAKVNEKDLKNLSKLGDILSNTPEAAAYTALNKVSLEGGIAAFTKKLPTDLGVSKAAVKAVGDTVAKTASTTMKDGLINGALRGGYEVTKGALNVGSRLASNAAVRGGIGAVGEGIIEGLQTAIELHATDPNMKVGSYEWWKQVKESALEGALVGGTIGSAASTIAPAVSTSKAIYDAGKEKYNNLGLKPIKDTVTKAYEDVKTDDSIDINKASSDTISTYNLVAKDALDPSKNGDITEDDYKSIVTSLALASNGKLSKEESNKIKTLQDSIKQELLTSTPDQTFKAASTKMGKVLTVLSLKDPKIVKDIFDKAVQGLNSQGSNLNLKNVEKIFNNINTKLDTLSNEKGSTKVFKNNIATAKKLANVFVDSIKKGKNTETSMFVTGFSNGRVTLPSLMDYLSAAVSKNSDGREKMRGSLSYFKSSHTHKLATFNYALANHAKDLQNKPNGTKIYYVSKNHSNEFEALNEQEYKSLVETVEKNDPDGKKFSELYHQTYFTKGRENTNYENLKKLTASINSEIESMKLLEDLFDSNTLEEAKSKPRSDADKILNENVPKINEDDIIAYDKKLEEASELKEEIKEEVKQTPKVKEEVKSKEEAPKPKTETKDNTPLDTKQAKDTTPKKTTPKDTKAETKPKQEATPKESIETKDKVESKDNTEVKNKVEPTVEEDSVYADIVAEDERLQKELVEKGILPEKFKDVFKKYFNIKNSSSLFSKKSKDKDIAKIAASNFGKEFLIPLTKGLRDFTVLKNKQGKSIKYIQGSKFTSSANPMAALLSSMNARVDIVLRSIDSILNSNIGSFQTREEILEGLEETFGNRVSSHISSDVIAKFRGSAYRAILSEEIGKAVLEDLGFSPNIKNISEEQLSLFRQEIGMYAITTLRKNGYIQELSIKRKDILDPKNSEESSNNATINLVKLTDKGTEVFKNTKENRFFDKLHNSMESLGLEPESKAMSYSTKPVSFKGDTLKVKGLGSIKVPKKIIDAFNTIGNTKYSVPNREVLLARFTNTAWVEGLKKTLGYKDINDPDILPSNLDGIRGKNLEIEKSINEFKEFLEETNEDGKYVSEEGIYFNPFLSKNGRLFYRSSTINPQSNKLHRFLLMNSNSLGTYNIKENGEIENPIVYQAAAQAFGFGTDKNSAKEAIEFGKKFFDIPIARLIKTVDNSIKKGEAEFEIDGIEVEMENPSHTYNALSVIKAYQEARNNKSNTFSGYSLSEIDAVTNGLILKSGKFMLSPKYVEILQAGGVDFINANSDNISAQFGDNTIEDIYKKLARDMSSGIDDVIKNKNNKGQAAYNLSRDSFTSKFSKKGVNVTADINKPFNLITNFLGDTLKLKDDKVTSKGRKLSKPIAQVFVYGASLGSSLKKLSRTISEELPDLAYKYMTKYKSLKGEELQEAAQAKDILKSILQLDPKYGKITSREFIEILKSPNGILSHKIKLKSNGKFPVNTTVGAVFDNILKGSLSTSIDISLSKSFPMLADTNALISSVFNARLKLVQDIYSDFKTKFKKAKDGMSDKGKDTILTLEDIKTIQTKLNKYIPGVKFSIATKEDIENSRDWLPITGKAVETNLSEEASSVMSIFDETSPNPFYKINSVMLRPRSSAYGDSGASSSVIIIHQEDGSAIILTIDNTKNKELGALFTAVHDALVIDSNNALEVNQEYNKNSYEMMKASNLIEDILKISKDNLKLVAPNTDYSRYIELTTKYLSLINDVSNYNRDILFKYESSYNNLQNGYEGSAYKVDGIKNSGENSHDKLMYHLEMNDIFKDTYKAVQGELSGRFTSKEGLNPDDINFINNSLDEVTKDFNKFKNKKENNSNNSKAETKNIKEKDTNESMDKNKDKDNPTKQISDIFKLQDESNLEKVSDNFYINTSIYNGYRYRTLENAAGADLTIAIASNFDTSGERLTKNSAKNSYIAEDIKDIEELGIDTQRIKSKVGDKPFTINFAGNRLATLAGNTKDSILGKIYTQEEVDTLLHDAVKTLKDEFKENFLGIRSGGQSGIDEAAIKAGIAHNIPSLVHAPKDWAFRDEKDITYKNKEKFLSRFKETKEETTTEDISLDMEKLNKTSKKKYTADTLFSQDRNDNDAEVFSTETLANDLESNPNTLNDLLTDMRDIDSKDNNSVSSVHSESLQALMSEISSGIKASVGDLKIEYSSISGDKVTGFYSPSNNTVTINSPKASIMGHASREEIFAHEVTHAATSFVISMDNGNNRFTRELRRLHSIALKNITAEDIAKELNTGSKETDLELAQSMFDHFKENTVEGLSEFSAMGLTNEVLANLLKNISYKEAKEPYKNLYEAIWDKFSSTFKTLYNKVTKGVTSNHSNLYEALWELNTTISKANQKARNKKTKSLTMKGAVLSAAIDKLDEATSAYLKDFFSKLESDSPFRLSDSADIMERLSNPKGLDKYLAMAEFSIKFAGSKTFRDDVMSIVDLDQFNAFNNFGIFRSIVDDLSTPDKLYRMVQDLQRKSNRIDAQRENMKQLASDNFSSKFNNELSKKDRQLLGVAILDTDLDSLTSAYTLDDISSILQDNNSLSSEINSSLNSVENMFNLKHSKITKSMYKQYIDNATDNLAHYMITNKAKFDGLLLNTTNIANMFGSYNIDVNNKALVKEIDKLTSLKALEMLDKRAKDTLVNTIAKYPQAMKELMTGIKSYNNSVKNVLFKNQDKSMIKGYRSEIYTTDKDLKIADISESDKLISQGYKRVSSNLLTSSGDVLSKEKAFFINENIPIETNFNRTAMRYTSRVSKGTTLKDVLNNELARGEEYTTATNKYNTSKNNLRKIHTKALMDSFIKPMKKTDKEVLIPIVGNNSNFLDFRYTMSKAAKYGILEMDSDIFDSLGQGKSRMYDKVSTTTFNKKVNALIAEDYKNNYGKNKEDKSRFIEFSIESKNPVVKELFKMLDEDTKADLLKRFSSLGSSKAFIRGSLVYKLLGFRDQDIQNTKVYKNVSNSNLKTIMRGSVALAKKATKWAKIEIVTKNQDTIIGNSVSNIYMCINYGMSVKDTINGHIEAIDDLNEYQSNFKRLSQLREDKKMGIKVSALEISNLERSLKSSKVYPLVEAGLYNTISEDLDKDNVKKDMFDREVEKALNKLPSGVKKAIDIAYITSNTKLNEVLNKVVHRSDFVARYTLYYHLLDKGYNSEQAINKVSDAFIDYDMATSPGRKTTEDLGLVMFSKFFSRIQRVLKDDLFMDHPVRSMGMILAQRALDIDLSDPFDASVLDKNWGTLFSDPITNLWEAANPMSAPILSLTGLSK
ncbi:hypothetical protein CFT13S00388_02425 [Campylobacter fetus subsp. testudinum]|uniref:hypothetical protein n=1 Tax=Campylobacter fetus TaxID=196 RepID=UPI00081895AD|nr:hypothetical protein [Campylobacter fetus]OCR88044.1 hypothetical protein CFT13S00388_02425 [Campylobacter fetus subsp. testudinum]